MNQCCFNPPLTVSSIRTAIFPQIFTITTDTVHCPLRVNGFHSKEDQCNNLQDCLTSMLHMKPFCWSVGCFNSLLFCADIPLKRLQYIDIYGNSLKQFVLTHVFSEAIIWELPHESCRVVEFQAGGWCRKCIVGSILGNSKYVTYF